MSVPLEHDYIGLERSSASSSSAFNLKQTELRLGLPGSQSPERNQGMLSLSINKKPNGYPLNSSKTSLVSGAKRGFSDAIDGSSQKWGFGSEDVKGAAAAAALLFSPKGESNAKTLQQLCVSGQVKKEAAASGSVVAQSPKAGQEKQKKPLVSEHATPPAAKAQVVGWPPIRSFRKNTMASNLAKNSDDAEDKQVSGCLYVKVSMDGAPYLRKVDLKMYNNYMELSMALEKMFSCFLIGKCNSKGLPEKDSFSESRSMDLLHGSEYVLTFEDKDDDWMLVGDVPWGMFTETCRKLRIMKGSEAIGLAPMAVEKGKNHN